MRRENPLNKNSNIQLRRNCVCAFYLQLYKFYYMKLLLKLFYSYWLQRFAIEFLLNKKLMVRILEMTLLRVSI